MQVFRAAVESGLSQTPKQIPCKFLYDERGASLFEAITELPAYYLTRIELGILETRAASIAARLGADIDLIELGSGACRKTRFLLSALREVGLYVPIDISREQLDISVGQLREEFPGLAVQPVCADFTAEDVLVPERRQGSRAVVFFPGSTLGNFEPPAASSLLARLASWAGREGGVLVGIDLRKDPSVLHGAYNDEQGLTAAFNRNILIRANRELGWNFCVDQFQHYAPYDPTEGRVTMMLVSQTRQSARCGSVAVDFDEGETIVTEHSYKYTLASFEALAGQAGLRLVDAWLDERRFAAVCYLAT